MGALVRVFLVVMWFSQVGVGIFVSDAACELSVTAAIGVSFD